MVNSPSRVRDATLGHTTSNKFRQSRHRIFVREYILHIRGSCWRPFPASIEYWEHILPHSPPILASRPIADLPIYYLFSHRYFCRIVVERRSRVIQHEQQLCHRLFRQRYPVIQLTVPSAMLRINPFWWRTANWTSVLPISSVFRLDLLYIS